MEAYKQSSTFIVFFGALLCLLLSSVTTEAFSAVIDNIEINDETSPAQLRINFTIPIQYLNHVPETSGDELEIQFQNISLNLFSVESVLNEQQVVTASKSSEIVPLLDARYEQRGPDRGVIIIRFARRMNYSIQAGADRRHITITILTPEIEKTPARTASPAEQVKDTAGDYPYAINLASSLGHFTADALPKLDVLLAYRVYTASFVKDGKTWYRLRLGFFGSRSDASTVLDELKAHYPDAWIAKVSADERLDSSRTVLDASKPRAVAETEIEKAPPEPSGELPPDTRPIEKAPPEPSAELLPDTRPADLQQPRPDASIAPVIKPTLPAAPDEKIAALMEEARQAVASGDNDRAVQLYTKVLQYPENPYRQDALEFLGVARERKGQLAHAIKEYQRYLALYPEGEGAERVKQRLVGLTTATDKPRTAAPGTRRVDEPSPWDVYGGLSQFYRRNEVTTDDTGDSVTQSSLSTDLDITARRRSSDSDLQSRFTGSYLKDFLDDGPGSESSVSSLYFDANSKPLGLSMRLGRQSRNTGGVLGRFDGLLAGYKMADWLTLNAVGGYPVFSSRDNFNTDKYLYGISADIGTLANAWDFNAFIIEQRIHNIVDRRAVGGEARYFDSVRSILTFVDYDIFYDSLNTFIFLGTWTLPGRTTINATLDYRNSPLLTTSSALQGQTVDSIDDLLDSLTRDEVEQLAEDRTGTSKTATLGISHPFSEKIQLSGDVTYSNLKGTETSGGIEAIPDTGNEYFYNLQLIGSSLFTSGDINIFGMRYSDTSTAKIYTLSLDSRYPVNNDWRINPRIRLDYRENDNDDSTQTTVLPSIRTDYRWRKRYRFEFEAGKEWSERDLTDRTEDSSSYFFNLGYRVDF
jgi:tetratricopeptide (TPR) repeat protein